MLIGVAGAALGWHQVDAVVGLGITAAIMFVRRGVAVQIWRRLMDAVDPEVLDRLEQLRKQEDLGRDQLKYAAGCSASAPTIMRVDRGQLARAR